MHVRERRAGAFRQCQVHGTAVGCRADRSDALNSAWLWWCAVCSCRPVGLGSATHGERCLWRWSGRICGQAWTAATAKARGYPAGGLATILSATSSRFIPVSLAASGAFGLSDRVCFLAGAWLCGWQLALGSRPDAPTFDHYAYLHFCPLCPIMLPEKSRNMLNYAKEKLENF